MTNKQIGIAENSKQLQQFLGNTLNRSKFNISKIRLTDQNEWNLNNDFFHII